MKNLFCNLLMAVMLVLVIAQYACANEDIIAAGISGINDKDVWIEEFDDE